MTAAESGPVDSGPVDPTKLAAGKPQGRKAPESVQVVKGRRDAALSALVGAVPYISFLGVRFDRRGI